VGRADETPEAPVVYPALARWLKGARADHPFDPAGICPPDVAQALEKILGDLDAANPKNIGRKRSAFKQENESNLLNLRVELLAGSLLARAGIGFDYGEPYPDLICRAEGIGIEVATRSRDAVRALHDRVEQALAEAGIDVLVSLEFQDAPLGIPEEQAAAITRSVVEAAAGGEAGTRHYADRKLRVTFFPGAATLASRVVYNRGVDLAPHFDDVEREMLNKLDEKRRQADLMPTVLLLDYSRLGMSWLRPPEVWASVAAEMLKSAPDFIGLACGFSDLTMAVFQGTATWRPGLPSEQDGALRRVMAALVCGGIVSQPHAPIDGIRPLHEDRN
jgi:hypothetical protein